MALEEVGGTFKVNAATIKIDPSLGVVNSGNIDIKPPPLDSDTGEPHMPAMINQGGPAQQRRQFFSRKPGATLAEQLGTEDAATTDPVPDYPQSTRPIDVPQSVPRRTSTVEQMADILTPKAEKVEVPVVVSQPEPVENPLGDVPKADLKGLVLRYIQKAGTEKACEFFGKSAGTINNWVNGKAEPTLAACQMILDKSPKARTSFLKVVEKVNFDEETGEWSFSRAHTKEEMPVDLCIATNKDFPPAVHWVFVTASAQYGIGQQMIVDAPLVRGRNLVAQQFLSGTAQWSIWLDHDVLPTIGNMAWWRSMTRNLGNDATVGDETASYHFIKRLISHNKPYVGGIYATRRKGGPLVTQPDLHPRGQKDVIVSDQIRKNQAKGLYGPVDWVATGLCAIHRSVFEAVIKQNPHLIPKLKGEPFPFFNQVANEGEDVAFDAKAKAAGFQLYLDQECFAAHLGRYPFLPSDSKHNGPVDVRNISS